MTGDESLVYDFGDVPGGPGLRLGDRCDALAQPHDAPRKGHDVLRAGGRR